MSLWSCPAFPFRDPLASHLIHDPFTGDAVIIAPGRRYRPDGSRAKKVKDPFSPAAIKKNEKVIKTYGKTFQVTVLENKYPVFHEDRPLEGRQEILVEGTRIKSFADFSVKEIEAVLLAMQDRCREFRKDRRLECMVVLKNEGLEAGASQQHPHSQIFGLPFVPDRWKFVGERRKHALKKHGMRPHLSVLVEATPARRIYLDQHVVAFADPASRFAYGVRIVPTKPRDNLTEATRVEITSFAKALHALLSFVRVNNVPFNFYFHDIFRDSHECFEMHFVPRVTRWGGFELDAGIAINPVPAECAAAEYREIRNTPGA